MFDLLLLIIGVILCLIGIVGSFVPIIPGPMTSWFGLLVLNFTDAVNFNLQFLAITLIIAIVISAMDYIIPIIWVKKLGGSSDGAEVFIGLMTGIVIMGPIGIFFGLIKKIFSNSIRSYCQKFQLTFLGFEQY